MTSSAQDFSVSGTVTDAGDGMPLPGVNIIVPGTTVGTVTNADGMYELTVGSDQDSLSFSFVGYQTATVAIEGRSTIDIALTQGVELDDLIVTGYQTQSRRDVTGAVSSVDIEDIATIPANSVGDQIQGRLPGVTVHTGGQPGSEARLRIRGIGTINSNDPLLIVDGVPTEGNLSSINPNDVESIQVLKDAASASIYGARAASGVIVITTKNGSQSDGAEVNIDYYSGVVQPTNIPRQLNTQQWGDVLWDAMENANIDPSHPQYGSGDEPVIPDYIAPVGRFEGDVDEDAYHWVDNPIIRASQEGTDWYDVIFDPAMMHNLHLSASGRNGATSYLISGNYLNQNGIIRHTGFDRFTARANTRIDVNDVVTVGENLAVSYTTYKGIGGAMGGASSMLPIVPIYDIEGNWAGSATSGLGNARNPYADMYLGRDDRNNDFRTFGNAFVEVAPISNATLRSSIGVDYGTNHNREFLFLDHWNTESPPFNEYMEFTSRGLDWTWTNTFNYETVLNEVHHLDLLIGTETISSRNRSLSAGRANYFSTDVAYRYIGTGTLGIENGGAGSNWGLNSLFAKADYIYEDQYLLSVTVRRDGSSRFGESNRYGVFPAVSAGWRVSSEPFMSGVDFVSNLMLRASWGQTGNQEIGNYRYATTYGINLNEDSYDIGGDQNSMQTGFDIKGFGNPTIGWETTSQTNVGLDADFLNGRLSFVVDAYRKNTTDMLLPVPVAATDGVASDPFVNIGSVLNEGLEVSGNYTGGIGAISYDVGLNVGTYRNEVTSLTADQTAIGSERRVEVGQPMSIYWGYIVDGIFQTQEEVDAHADQNGTQAVGRLMYRDLNDDGVINSEDQTYIGNPHPDFSYGLNTRLWYKSFDLGVFIQGLVGNHIWNSARSGQEFWHFVNNRSTRILDAWSPDNPDARIPQVNANNPFSESTRPSTYFIEDGSYLRLKSLQLGYTLPDQILSGVRIYAQGKNLLTLTNYMGIDPEVGGSDTSLGVDNNHYPLARTYTLGVNVTL